MPVVKRLAQFLRSALWRRDTADCFTALTLAFAGVAAIFLSVTGHFLPHDVEFLGMQPSALCELNQCRIVHFMVHDRMSFRGVLLSIAVLYLWLALFPLREGEPWAWWTLLVTNLSGFGSFLAYMGYGYLDVWHGWATLGLLPFTVLGLWQTHALISGTPPAQNTQIRNRFERPLNWGWLLWMGWGLGLAMAGATILTIGMTHVFVPRDLEYLGYAPEQLNAINPRIIPLIAHDRAGFGGGVLTLGLLILGILYHARMSRHLWQALSLAGILSFVCAIGIHYPIGYLDPLHLAPAWGGAVIFVLGLVFSWNGLKTKEQTDQAH